ncbi:hypothetical protein PBI_SCTP2_56 [Salicola phage SCTP-2]|nr:hypothetical protein PBI_SCTP2_56 [Salicola phage SCTP-2]
MKVILNEGVITVPQSAQDQAYEIVVFKAHEVVYDVFKNTPMFLEFLQDKISYDISPNGDQSFLDLKPSQAFIYDLYVEQVENPYSESDEGFETLTLALMNIDNTASGAYDEKNNMVVVNFHSLIEALSMVRDTYKEMYTTDDLSKKEIFEELDLFDFDKTVKKHLTDFIKDSKSTIEHELAHYIQHNYLKQKSEKQVEKPDYKHEHGSKENYDEYFGSEVEYSPQILSAVRDFEKFFNSMSDESQQYIDKQYKRNIFNYIVGQTNTLQTLSEYSGENLKGIDNTLTNFRTVKLPRSFFMSLKNSDNEKWKKAVKYFWNEINKRGLI